MADITSNLVLRYSMDPASISGTTLTDDSGNGNTGTLVNGPTQVAGKVGGALQFVAANSQYVTNSTFSYAFTNLTVAAWISISPSSTHAIVCTDNTSGGHGWFFQINSNRTLSFFTDTRSYVGGSTAIPTGWVHVVAVISGSTLAIYANGINVTSSQPGGPLWNGYPGLLVGSYALTRLFNGIIDEVRVYSRALSSADVAALYAFTGSRLLPNFNGGFQDGADNGGFLGG